MLRLASGWHQLESFVTRAMLGRGYAAQTSTQSRRGKTLRVSESYKLVDGSNNNAFVQRVVLLRKA